MGNLRRRDKAFARVFGANLARYREELGVSQENLGLMAGLHRTAVGQLERGERIARSDTVIRLCGSLCVGPEALLAGLRWRPTQLAEGELQIEPVRPSQPTEAEEETKEGKPAGPARNPDANK
jgi:transcriptional regulator with XRE-family HTH domain